MMSELLNGLNPSQRKAVTHKDCPLLIIAGPGSGKTLTVAHSIAYAIEKGVQPDRILAFSFTVKASADLQDQVIKVVKKENGHFVNISTFHRFCRWVLREDLGRLRREYTLDFKDLEEDEQEKADQKIVVQAIHHLQYYKFVKPQDVLNFIIRCKARDISPSEARNHTPDPYKSEAYVKIYEKYEQRLKACGWIDYENQQLFTDQLFREDIEVRAKWQSKFDLIFVDEYQDTDPVQYRIIKYLAEKHRNLRVVGDDDQGIYGFRGADIQNILDFEQDYHSEVIKLEQNYRSTKNIVKISNALVSFNVGRQGKELFTTKSNGPTVKHLHCKNSKEEALTICNFIDRSIQEGRNYSDFAVLYRTNKQARVFEESFAKSRIPYYNFEKSKKHFSAQPKDVVSLMTIHKSKGLEFSNVLVVGVCQELLPHYYNRNEKNWDEEIRLLYVAMTRARNWLCLSSYEKAGDHQYGKSPFLERGYVPPNLLEYIETLNHISVPPAPEKMGVPQEAYDYVEPLPKKLLDSNVIVLGVDPGVKNVGWSITQKSSDCYSVIDFGTLESVGWKETLELVRYKIDELVGLYSIDAIAIEQLEGAKKDWFVYVAGCVAEIQRISRYYKIEECPLYTPQQVKYAATGNRQADKEQVEQGVKKRCSLKKVLETDHEADAIAASLCYLRSYLNSSRFQGNLAKKERYDKGYAFLDNRQYDAAVVQFKEAINIDPIYTEAHCGLGRAYLELDKLVKAESLAKEALRLDPDYQLAQALLDDIKQAYYNRGRGHLDNHRYDEAVDAFTLTIKKYPNFAAAYCGLGVAYLVQGELEAAESSAHQTLRLDPDYQPARGLLNDIKQAHCDLGLAYLVQKNLRDAERSANEALRLNPNYRSAHELLNAIKQAHCDCGNSYLAQGDLRAAESSANETLRLDPDYPPVYRLLNRIAQSYCVIGDTYLKKGQLEAAERAASEAGRLDPNYQPAQDLLEAIGKAYCNCGLNYITHRTYIDAVKYLQRAKQINPDDKNVYTSLGLAYYWLDEYDKAADCYKKAIDIDPNDKTAHTNLGNAYYRMGVYEKAIAPFQKAWNLDLNCEKTCYYLARAYFKLKNLEEAKLAVEKALYIVPTYQAAIELLNDIKWAADYQMIRISAGEFQMGSNNENRERPVHNIYIDEFYIDIYLVTNVQFKKFVDANPEWQKANIPDALHDGNYLKYWDKNNFPGGEEDHPVVYINWYTAMAYAQWAGKRLPTEAEWEKAARGGLIGKNYPWGNSINTGQANYGRNVEWTTSVGIYPANEYGLYDVVGNVWEWCLDMYDRDFYLGSPDRNPISGGTITCLTENFTNIRADRVLRGGSWHNPPSFVRVAVRDRLSPTTTGSVIGFRCAKSVTD